ncbi:MAG TPA: carboxypeptidase-like regulatory domain-containing protein [Longimicrobium sp.]|nr:carboxypeptidase-like regulatory domain-containing protein [Longimicrobium sp.]
MTRRLMLAMALLPCAAAPAAAQTVDGRAVERETLRPVPAAFIVLLDSAGEPVAAARSDSAGAFSVAAPGPGTFALNVQRPGFGPTLTRGVPLGAGETVAVEVRMAAEAAAGAPATEASVAQRIAAQVSAVKSPAPRAPAAQAPAAPGRPTRRGITGRLLDDRTGQPVPGARIELLTRREQRVSSVLTDSAGAFHFSPPATGAYLLHAERVGYQPVRSTALTLAPDDTVQVELRVATDAVLLAPLTVVAGAPRTVGDERLDGFEFRRRTKSAGRFLGPDEIRRLNPFSATDAVLHVPFVRVSGSGAYRWLLLRKRHGLYANHFCHANLYIDGAVVRGLDPSSAMLDQLVSGRTLAAIEVYPTHSSAPGEFPPVVDPNCGVIVLWTHPEGTER